MKLYLRIAVLLFATVNMPLLAAEPAAYPDLDAIPAVRAFMAGAGLGTAHPKAAAELAQFGRLVGVWDASLELRKQDGSWIKGAPALWVWKYILDGFATQDLWIHTADHLPVYLQTLGRPYLLTGLRIFDPSSGTWRIAWAANGAGQSPGMDFGIFTATARGQDMVLEDSSSGDQRAVFSEITNQSFTWTSEYKRGDEWAAVMRVKAVRRTMKQEGR